MHPRILFIHPEQGIWQTFRICFREEIAQWQFALNGEQGLLVAEEWMPGLIYIYWRIPDNDAIYPLNAIAFTKTLRQHPSLAHVPVVFLCNWAFHIAQYFDSLRRMGVRGVIQQPAPLSNMRELQDRFLAGGEYFPSPQEMLEGRDNTRRLLRHNGPIGATAHRLLIDSVSNAVESGAIERELEA